MQEKLYPSLPRFIPKTNDHSSMKLAKECFRKYFYRIILGRTPPKSKYQVIFDFGSAYHKFREVLELSYMEGKSRTECLGLAVQSISEMPLTPGEGKYEFYTRQRLLETCMMSYNEWCREKDNKRIEVIAVEQPFNIQMPNGTYISGRADQIIKWNGKIWGRDFKTTSKMQMYFDATLDPNDQAIRYIYMESKLTFGADAINNGRFIEGIIFEVVQNMKTVPPKMYKTIISKNRYQLLQWEKEQMLFDRILQLCHEEDTWPMCESACSFCDYSRVCKTPSEAGQENILKNNFILSPWDNQKVTQEVLKED